MKQLEQYRLVLFDMDGTLYYKRPMQMRMAGKLLTNVCANPKGFWELLTVLKFRRLREHWTEKEDVDNNIYALLAEQMKCSPDEIKEVIEKWIHEIPLQVLAKSCDKKMIAKMYELQKKGIAVAIYSDYPVEAKQKVLGMAGIRGFYGGQKEIGCLKPAPDGIRFIMKQYDIENASEVLIIGDRMCKDGQAAINAGADYLIFSQYALIRKCQWCKMN